MQQHTAQHLLTREALNRYGWATRSFHIGPRVSDIELDCQPPEEREIEALEDGVARRVCEARPIRGFRVDPEELSALEVRSRGLPAGHTGTIRLIEIEGFDLNTCGGTHVASTAEVETFKIVTSEPLRGGCRLFWVAGKRVRRRLATEVTRLAELRSLLDCGDEDLAAGVQLKLDQLRELNRHCRRLEKRFAEARALELARSGEIVVDLHLDASDASLLRPLADCLINVASDKIALLTSETEGQPLFAVVIGGDHDLEVIEIGKAVSEILGGRGGGASRIFQGKASSLAERSQALSYLRRLTD